MHCRLAVFVIIVATQLASSPTFAADGTSTDGQSDQSTASLFSALLRGLRNDAANLYHNFTSLANRTLNIDAELNRLKQAITIDTKLLPKNLNQQEVVNALTEAANQSAQLRRLNENFNGFLNDFRKFQRLFESRQSFTDGVTGFLKNSVPINTSDETTFAGKVNGFFKTGKINGNSLSDLCNDGRCGSFGRGIDNLKRIFSTDSDSDSNRSDGNGDRSKISTGNNTNNTNNSAPSTHDTLNSLINRVFRVDSEGAENRTQAPVDYFDFYYNSNPQDEKNGTDWKAAVVDYLDRYEDFPHNSTKG